MNRRDAIYNFVLLSAGAIILPSCGQSDTAASIAFRNFSLTADEQKMMQQLTDFIIPKTGNFIGASDLQATAFTLMMVDDCYAPEKQKTFKEGLQAFDKLANEKYGSSFSELTDAQKKAMLTAVESKKDIPENVLEFYGITKRHTIQAFTSSQKYMTEVSHYKMVPGSNFKGCVPVKQA
ncbi:hypothetical protein BH11BAC3_BH11BAC3_44460 [soil metagenome]